MKPAPPSSFWVTARTLQNLLASDLRRVAGRLYFPLESNSLWSFVMKSIVCLTFALVVVAGFSANAEEVAGRVSSDSLSKLGLSGMKVATKAESESVRGMGFASVSGYSFGSTQFGNQAGFGTNSYVATSSRLFSPSVAAGGSNSYGGLSISGGWEQFAGSTNGGNTNNGVGHGAHNGVGHGGGSNGITGISFGGSLNISAFGGGGAFAYAR